MQKKSRDVELEDGLLLRGSAGRADADLQRCKSSIKWDQTDSAHFDRLLGASAVVPNDNPRGTMGAEGGRKDGFNALIMSTGFSLADCDDLLSLAE